MICPRGHETTDPDDCLSCALGMPPEKRRKAIVDVLTKKKRQPAPRKDCTAGRHRILLDATECSHCKREATRKQLMAAAGHIAEREYGVARRWAEATDDTAKRAAALADKAEFRRTAFPMGRVPSVHEIIVTSTGRRIVHVICPKGMIAHSARRRKGRRRRYA